MEEAMSALQRGRVSSTDLREGNIDRCVARIPGGWLARLVDENYGDPTGVAGSGKSSRP